MSDAHRDKIRASNIINALQEHVEGSREMSASQVTAGLGLLKKVLPDISENRLADGDGGPLQVIINRFASDKPS